MKIKRFNNLWAMGLILFGAILIVENILLQMLGKFANII